MSVELPVVAVVFGSVTPPQGDILELRVHLGCTKEVSSFECLLQNFNKKYSSGGTYPINVGDDGSISIGRGTNCPLILTLRVEEIEPESTPVENYIRVSGRCWGEKIFRKVVTKTYENQKGEAIVKDLLDNFVGLSHVRDTTELVEDTDTTYTLLEYENTPVFDILKYIAESADKAGVIGYDFRVEHDGKFAFFPKNSKTSPINLSERIEVSHYSKDIHRIRNKIMVYGAAEKANPSNRDAWTETLDINNDATNDWTSGTGTGSVSLDNAEKILGSYSIKHTTSTPDYYGCAVLTFPSGMEVDGNKYPSLSFQVKEESAFNGNIGLELEDSAGMKVRREIGVSPNNKWHLQGLNVGKKHSDEWTHSIFNSQPFNWASIKKILWYCNFSGTGTGKFWIDNLFFNRKRWEATRADSGSQTNYGVRELVEVDEELHSDNECDLRAKALLDHLSVPAEFLTVQTTCLDYGTNRLLPGDKIHVTLPNENIDSDFRIISVEYRVIASEQTLEITLELGKEKPLLADYLYGLRATTVTVEKLMRTKAGLTGVAGSAGGGGGGGGMTQHGNEWHDPDMALQSDFASHKDRHKSGGADAFVSADHLDGIARVKVRKNSGASDVGARRRLNLIEGTNVTLTVADDPTDEEVDVTIASSGGGSGTDEKVKISAQDITNNYLEPKLTAGPNINITKQNPGGNENLLIEALKQLTFLATGMYYRSILTAAVPNTVGYAGPNWLYATLYPITRKMTFNEAAIQLFSGEAGKKVRLGIYDDLNGAPNNLIQDFGEIAIDTAGLKTIAISPALQLNPGIYWLAYVSDSTLAQIYSVITGLNLIGSTTTLRYSTGSYYRSYTYAALPDPFGTPMFSQGYLYAIGLKLQSVP